MNRFKLSIAVAFVVGFSHLASKAETISGYICTFSKSIDVNDHAFKVASGWGHIVGMYDDVSNQYYQSYYWTQYGGAGSDSGYLRFNTWNVGSTWNKHEVSDYIVTPAVSGNVALQARWENSYAGNLEFYHVKMENGEYVVGEKMSADVSALNNSSWKTVEIGAIEENAEYPYIGIRGNTVRISDFTADKATYERVRALQISSVTTNAPYNGVVCDENNMASVKVTANICNTGDFDLAAGDDGFSLTVLDASGKELATVQPETALSEGASATVTIDVEELDYSIYGGEMKLVVRENVSLTVKETPQFKLLPYLPKLELREGSTVQNLETPIDFGKVNTVQSKTYKLCNDNGKAPAVITAIECPAGFSVSLEAPVTIGTSYSDRRDIVIAFSPEGIEPGELCGNIVFTLQGAEPFVIPIKVTVLDTSLIYVDFEDGKFPDTFVRDASWKVEQRSLNYAAYIGYQKQRLVLPKLSVKDGKKLQLDIKQDYSSAEVNFSYSSDRMNWIATSQTLNGNNPLSSDFQTFEVEEIPDGDWFIAIDAKYAYIDNIYGLPFADVAHDMSVVSSEVPSAGMVNYPISAKVKVKNYNSKPEAEGGYTVALIVGEEELELTDVPEIVAGGEKEFVLSLTPHVAGVQTSRIEIRFGGIVLATGPVDINVDEEKASDMKVLPPSLNSGGAVFVLPLNNYAHCESEQIYPAEMIAAAAGSKINGIAFQGICANKEYTTHIKAYLALTDKEVCNADKTFAMDVADMTLVYDGDYTIPVTGYSQKQWILDLPFVTPFVYDGTGNLMVRLVAENADGETSQPSNIQFDNYNSGDDKKWSRYIYHGYKADGTVAKTDNYFLGYGALRFLVETGVVSGALMDGDMGIADAVVTLRSGDVMYRGATDSDGTYAIEVLQVGKVYSAEAQVDGYKVSTVDDVDFTSVYCHERLFKAKPKVVAFEEGVPATVILPDMSAAPQGKYYEFDRIDTDKMQLVFKMMDTAPEVNVPYVVVPSQSCEVQLGEMELPDEAGSVTVGEIMFAGTYGAHLIGDGECDLLDVLHTEPGDEQPVVYAVGAANPSNPKFVRATGAYLNATGYSAVLEDDTTGIENVDTDTSAPEGVVYSVDGVVVATDGNTTGLLPGIYIFNGRKILVR